MHIFKVLLLSSHKIIPPRSDIPSWCFWNSRNKYWITFPTHDFYRSEIFFEDFFLAVFRLKGIFGLFLISDLFDGKRTVYHWFSIARNRIINFWDIWSEGKCDHWNDYKKGVIWSLDGKLVCKINVDARQHYDYEHYIFDSNTNVGGCVPSL